MTPALHVQPRDPSRFRLGRSLAASLLVLGLLVAGVAPARASTATVGVTQSSAIINSVGPAIVGPGSAIDIRGTNFSAGWFTTVAVVFNGVAASSFTVVSPTEITAILPTLPVGYVTTKLTLSSGSGSIYGSGVIEPYNTGPPSTPTPSTVPTAPAQPPPSSAPTPPPVSLPPLVITGVQPTAGPSGSTVTIAGSGFSGPGFTTSSVTVGGAPAAFTVISPNVIQVVIPVLPLGSAPIVVSTSNGSTTATSGPAAFTVTSGTAPPGPPVISGIRPSSGAPGDSISVTGGPFSGPGTPSVSEVLVGGQPASFTVVGPNEIQFTVPNLQPGPASVVIVFSDGSHSIAAPGVAFTVKGVEAPAPIGPPSASSSAGAGAFIDFLLHPHNVVQLILEILSIVLVLGLLTILLLLLMRRRRRGTPPSTSSSEGRPGDWAPDVRVGTRA